MIERMCLLKFFLFENFWDRGRGGGGGGGGRKTESRGEKNGEKKDILIPQTLDAELLQANFFYAFVHS